MQPDKQRVRDLERRRVAAANNTAAIFGQIGAIPNDTNLMMVRLEALLDAHYGVMELDDDGRYIGGSVDRLEYETVAAETFQTWAEQRRDAYFAAVEAAKKTGGGKLVIPGGHGRSGLVTPNE